MPYGWTQTLQDVTVLFPVPKTTKGKDVVVEFGKTHLKAGLKGQPLLIDVRARTPAPPCCTTTTHLELTGRACATRAASRVSSTRRSRSATASGASVRV